MKDYNFTNEEKLYLREIFNIIRGKVEELHCVVGYDKQTGERKILLMHCDGDSTYAVAEILNDSSKVFESLDFEERQQKGISYTVGRKKRKKFWDWG